MSDDLDRRRFLALGGGLLAMLHHGATSPRPDVRHVGLQLYTVREAMQRDFEGTLRRVAEIGFSEVEFAGTFGRPARAVRAALDAAGLVAPSAHVDLLGGDVERLLDDAALIGHRHLVLAWLPAELRSEEGYRRVADALNRAGEAARRRGIGIAYHNHDFEFDDIGGRAGLDILLERGDPELLGLELDVYWAARAGQDPLVWMDRAGRRLRLMHAKDIAADGSMADVGSGTLDFAALLERGRGHGLQHVFVEHDNPPEAFATASAGLDHLRPLIR